MTNTYQIPECNLDALTTRIAKLNKRAAKLGCAPVTMAVGEYEDIGLVTDHSIERGWFDRVARADETPMRFRRVYAVTVAGEAPKLNGWTFAGTLQRVELEDGTETGLMRSIEGVAVPEAFRQRVGQCDHCRADRRRNDVYIVRNEASDYKVIGSTCLRDFLGHEDPHGAAQMAELLAELGDLCAGAEDDDFFGMGGRGQARFSVDAVLANAAAIVRLDGFMSRKRAEDTPGGVATSRTLADLFTPPATEKERAFHARYRPTDDDEATAEAAREWARGFAESDNDYLYNLSVVARSASLTSREFGLAAAMISSYKREMAERAESAMETSRHFGEKGERLTLSVVFESCRESAGDWGLTTICRYRTVDGNLVTWFASGTPDPALTVVGQPVAIDATVKAHGEFRGVKQTTLTRVKLHVEKPKKARKSKTAEVPA